MIRSTTARRLAVLAAALLAGAGCITSPTIRTVEAGSEPSPKLNPFVYYEQGNTLFLGVDTRAAGYERRALLPIGLGSANLSRGPITLHRESFVLEDEDGTRYPLASYEEFRREYRSSRTDRSLSNEFIGILTQRFATFTPRRWAPFPSGGASAPANDQIELGRRHWNHTLLYFPVPPGGVKGREFTLLVTPRDLPETMIVRFRIR